MHLELIPGEQRGMGKRGVRAKEPQRDQGWLFVPAPEVGPKHPARLVAAAVERLDFGDFLRHAKALEGVAGRPVTSPALLLSLWLCGIQQGIGGAKELARRCQPDAAFRWLCGGVEPSHDVLSDFRVKHLDALQALLHHGLVTLEHVALDGTRVRASASASSFRRQGSLEACREPAALHLKAVLATSDEYPEAQQAAREPKAREYQARVEAARQTLQAEREKKSSAKEKAAVRASTPDPEARVMKMADGGFRPGFNAQPAVAGNPEGGPRTIVAVNVTPLGSDMGSLRPMVQQVEKRTGVIPSKVLADANHATLADTRRRASRRSSLCRTTCSPSGGTATPRRRWRRGAGTCSPPRAPRPTVAAGRWWRASTGS